MLPSYRSLTLLRTRLSSKGQIVLPKSLRDAHSWVAGMEFTIESTTEGVLLRPAALFPPSELDEVAGSLTAKLKLLTPTELRQAISGEVRQRHERGRY